MPPSECVLAFFEKVEGQDAEPELSDDLAAGVGLLVVSARDWSIKTPDNKLIISINDPLAVSSRNGRMYSQDGDGMTFFDLVKLRATAELCTRLQSINV